MKPKFKNGIYRGAVAIFAAMIVKILGNIFSLITLLTLISVLSIFSAIILAGKMKYWNDEYVIGWIVGIGFGIFIMVKTGIISYLDLFLYVTATIGGFYIKYSETGNRYDQYSV